MTAVVQESVLCVADVHWRPASSTDAPEPTGLFGRFLAELSARARATGPLHLYVLGDLFDFWLERRGHFFAFYEPHVEALAAAAASGVHITLLFGNRDFTYGRALERRGLEIAGERAEVVIGGRRALLQHGDLLCTGDRRYQVYRRVIRSAPARGLMRLVPMRSLAPAIIRRMQRASAAEIRRKRPDSMGVKDAAVAAEHARGFDLVICGHVHQPQQRRVPGAPPGAELVVLGPWDEQRGWYATFSRDGVRLQQFPDEAGSSWHARPE